ncbi:hypothetical protein L3X38_018723 [Prunus dulcis]|uniref:Uncharacterized protein n=1 Tax=Prunus dulcis TaxID=3755 RepID=A0AAD4WC53_PRUDU|nr:hypothetical protein L3X38_018723 [Prunus dulcis]
MAWRLCSRRSSFLLFAKSQTSDCSFHILQDSKLSSRSYARGGHKPYDLFGNGQPGDKDFRKAWKKEIDEDASLWTGSEEESDNEKDEKSHLEKEIRKVRQQAREHSNLIDADDSDELRSVWSGSDEEKSLWTGSEGDDDDDIPTEPYPNESSDKHIDKLFEFEETSKYRTISELLKLSRNRKNYAYPGKSQLWAICKRNIVQSPLGYNAYCGSEVKETPRLLTCMHDHLYHTQLSCSVPLSIFWYNEVPSAKKLRIMVDIHKYFLEHPEYLTDGVILLQFFISNPEAVVGKLCPQVSCIDSILMPLDLLNLVKNLAWLGPDGSEDLQLDKAALLPPLYLRQLCLTLLFGLQTTQQQQEFH